MKTAVTPIQKAHAQRRELGEQTKRMVIDAIAMAKEPVTAREIVMHMAKHNKRRLTVEYMLNLLKKMSAEGQVFVRGESSAETAVRTNRSNSNSLPARLYSLSQTVPARTMYEVLPGVNYNLKFANKGKSAKLIHWQPGDHMIRRSAVRPAGDRALQTGRPAGDRALQTDSNLEIERLRARVAELEAQISTLRKILS